jgi:hypothetical protein
MKIMIKFRKIKRYIKDSLSLYLFEHINLFEFKLWLIFQIADVNTFGIYFRKIVFGNAKVLSVK